MRSVAAMAALAALMMTGPVMAQEACARPTAPAPVDGATATMEQLMAARKDAMEFIAASDTFQSCVIKNLEKARADAKANKKKVDPAVVKAADADIAANQKDKEAVGAATNAAVKAYKAAHPT